MKNDVNCRSSLYNVIYVCTLDQNMFIKTAVLQLSTRLLLICVDNGYTKVFTMPLL